MITNFYNQFPIIITILGFSYNIIDLTLIYFSIGLMFSLFLHGLILQNLFILDMDNYYILIFMYMFFAWIVFMPLLLMHVKCILNDKYLRKIK